MQQQLRDFVASNDLIHTGDRILVGVSGGRDSIALAHVLHGAGYQIAIAHMNYRLRGDDSEEDLAFVKAFAQRLDVPFHQKIAWKKPPKANLQAAARQARYEHFEHLCIKHSYDKIATAHHFEDKVESMFINLIRGTGIHGMKGIPVSRGNIIRPLLWADRQTIDTYIEDHGLEYREDASNDSDTYLRNRIRHHLVPMLQELDPEALNRLGTSMDMLDEDAAAIRAVAENAIEHEGHHISIHLSRLPERERATWLYHCLREYGFNRTQCHDLLGAKQPGKRIESGVYDAVLSARTVDVIGRSKESIPALHIDKPGLYNHHGIALEIRPSAKKDQLISGGNVNVTLDAAKLTLPFTLRTVERNDRFHPLGLNYEVVLKDYLREKGLSPAQISNCFILATSDGKIAWVPEVQIAQWCKIESHTTSILSLSFRRNGN